MKTIDRFIRRLKARSESEIVFNPYGNPELARNLKHYLLYLYEHSPNPVLLVGEAPGFRGCRLTGIPFSSGGVIPRSR